MPTFEEVDVRSKEYSFRPMNTTEPLLMDVTKDLIDGYTLQKIKGLELDAPVTSASRAFGTLWYGNQRPSLILSSEAVKKDMLRKLIPSTVVPVYRKGKLGFQFTGADWIDDERLEGTSWVVLLNEQIPSEPRLNGCYEYLYL